MTSEILVSAVVGLLAAIVGAVVIVFGWSVTHRKELERNLAAKRRELRVQFLIDAYRRLNTRVTDQGNEAQKLRQRSNKHSPTFSSSESKAS